MNLFIFLIIAPWLVYLTLWILVEAMVGFHRWFVRWIEKRERQKEWEAWLEREKQREEEQAIRLSNHE